MSERGRTTKTRGQRLAGFTDAINQGAINRRVGVYVSWLIVAMTPIGAADTASRQGFGANSDAFPEIQWVLFAALFLLAVACALQRKQHVRVALRQCVKLRPDPNDNIPAALKAAQECHKKYCAVNPVMPRFSQSRKIFRYAQFHPYRVPEIAFSNFMAGQQLPFR
jgi:hypothetical protein